MSKVDHLNIRVQSNSKGPDYLEARINYWLGQIKIQQDLPESQEQLLIQLDKTKNGLIASLK